MGNLDLSFRQRSFLPAVFKESGRETGLKKGPLKKERPDCFPRGLDNLSAIVPRDLMGPACSKLCVPFSVEVLRNVYSLLKVHRTVFWL